MQEEYEPGHGVGQHNGAGEGCNETEEGQGVLVRQHEQEEEAEEPAAQCTGHQSSCLQLVQ